MIQSICILVLFFTLCLVPSSNALELYRFRAIIEGFKRDELLRYPKNSPELEKSLKTICDEGDNFSHWCYFKYIYQMHQQFESENYFHALKEGYNKVKGLQGLQISQSESYEKWMMLHAFKVKSVDEFKQQLKNQESKSLAALAKNWNPSFYAFATIKFPVINGKVTPVTLGENMDHIMEMLSAALFEKYHNQLKQYIDNDQSKDLTDYMNNEVEQVSKLIGPSRNAEARKSWLMNQIPTFKKSFDLYNFGRNKVISKHLKPARAAKVCIDTVQNFVPHHRDSVLPESKTYWGKFSAFSLFNTLQAFEGTLTPGIDQSLKTKFDIEILYTLFTSRSDDVLDGFKPYLRRLDKHIFHSHLVHIINLTKANDRAKIMDYKNNNLRQLKSEILDRFCGKGRGQKFIVCKLNDIESVLNASTNLDNAVSKSNSSIAIEEATTVVNLYLKQKAEWSAPLSLFDKTYRSLSYLLLFGADNKQSVKSFIKEKSAEKKISVASVDSRVFLSILAAYSKLSSKHKVLWEEFKDLFEYYDEQVALSHLMVLQPLVKNNNLNGMKLYLQNNWNGFLVNVVLFNICDISLFKGWVMCGLRNIVAGIRSYIAIETRGKATTVPIEDLQNINVKTKIEILIDDQRHFEVISSIENSANRIVSQLGGGSQQLLQSFGAAFKQLGRYFERDSTLSQATLNQQTFLSRETFVQLFGEATKLEKEISASQDAVGQLARLLMNELLPHSEELKKRFQQLENLQNQNQNIFAKILSFVKKDSDVSHFAASYLQLYNLNYVSLMVNNINDIEGSTSGMIDYMCGLVESKEMDLGVKKTVQQQCGEVRGQFESIFPSFTEMCGELNAEFEKLASLARAVVNQQSSNQLIDFAKQLQVKRVDAGPIHVLEYAILTKLYMEYQLQEGAYQFCTFHEYRMGRRPSMCMNKSYFSLNAIKQMRSFLPPNSEMKKSTLVVQIPTTKKTVRGSKGEPRVMPFVNLTAIASGETVSFSLPSWNMEWLKQHGWTLYGDKSDLITFVESFELYLPIVGEREGLNQVSVKATVRSGKIQPQLSGDNIKLYSLNRRVQSLQYSIGDPSCVREREVVNPYHRSAQCVKPDLSSKLCILDSGKQGTSMLLPTMFTEWEVSFEMEKNRGYKIATPAEGIELDILAKLVVQRVNPPPTRNLRVSADQCCKNNEYRYLSASGRRSCVACPKGTKSGLNGYTCLA